MTRRTLITVGLVAVLVIIAIAWPVGADPAEPGPDPAPSAPMADAAPAPSCNRPPLRTWTRAEVRCTIRRAFTRDASMALCVAWHESRYQPHATGAAGERGIFQLHPVHRAWLGRRWARLYDPAVNARAARDLVRRAGWRPWTTAALCP